MHKLLLSLRCNHLDMGPRTLGGHCLASQKHVQPPTYVPIWTSICSSAQPQARTCRYSMVVQCHSRHTHTHARAPYLRRGLCCCTAQLWQQYFINTLFSSTGDRRNPLSVHCKPPEEAPVIARDRDHLPSTVWGGVTFRTVTISNVASSGNTLSDRVPLSLNR